MGTMSLTSRAWLFAALLAGGLPAAAQAQAQGSRVDALVAALGGDDERARSEARQLLPREGAAVVPKLLPLVKQDDPAVWRAASNVLADIANEVSVPGREAERDAVAAQLMTLVAADQPAAIKIRGLRLLPVVTPPEFDVGPVAALLGDPELRDKARSALEEMATPKAREALRRRLESAEPGFASALLDSLGRLRDRDSLEAIARRAADDDPRVRAAAVRALSWTGDASYLKAARAVVGSADAGTRADAGDAELRLVDAVARKGDNRPVAVAAYREILKRGRGVEKDAALAGLGRYGGGSSVGAILDAIRDAGPPTSLVGLEALRALRGADVARALVDAYPASTPALQASLIPVLGSRKDPAALPILDREARSDDAARRLAALEALGELGHPEGLGLLRSAAKDGDERSRSVARKALIALADSLASGGRRTEAGRAFLAAFDAATPDETDFRRRAIEGIASNPVAEAEAAARAAVEDKALREPATRALLGVAGALVAAGRKEKAVDLYEAVRRLDPPASLRQALVKGMADAGVRVDMASLRGIVTRWWVVGPFDLGEKNQGWDTEFIGEPDVSVVARYMSGKSRVAWKPVTTKDPDGKVDLRASVSKRDRCIGYAYAEVTVDEPTDAVLLIGADDSERVWVNGRKVFETFRARGLSVDEDRVPVRLKAGVNKILLKLYQETEGWEFCLRIVDSKGRPLKFVQNAD
jgi:HEAT repeat protein